MLPSRGTFEKLACSGKQVPLARVLPLERSAQELFEAVDFSGPKILLESGRMHPVTGRYSMLVGEPEGWLTAKGQAIQIYQEGSTQRLEGNPFQILADWHSAHQTPPLNGFPPFVGGAIVLLGYDAFRYFQDSFRVQDGTKRPEDDLQLPDLVALFCRKAVVLDHLEKKLWVIVLTDPDHSPSAAYDAAMIQIDQLTKRLSRRIQKASAPLNSPPAQLHSTHSRKSFEAMVQNGKTYIAAGEIYQANLSQRLSAPLCEAPWTLYRRLGRMNPSPFASFCHLPSFHETGEENRWFQLVSASPERLFQVKGETIETRPIAGTRPRGSSYLQQTRLRQELLLNEKERAEHLMLVDLERNDLGRVCHPGTVQVNEFMTLEEYSHVTHIVSNVRGRLDPKYGFSDLIEAVFPGGTITGCPKVRCIEIIDALEPVRRQFYTGSLGYWSACGSIDLNLLIRTALVVDQKVHIQVGAGIVADSDPAREYEETLYKGQALKEVFLTHPERKQDVFADSTS